MAKARIFKPAKTAMQSGYGKTKNWILEFEPSSAKKPEHLMGWVTSDDMEGDQVRLFFPNQEAAENFAKNCGIDFFVHQRTERVIKPKSYADNFSPDRTDGNWTH
ncbi:MAG: ETC complex I subunit [Pseudomonadota bacterium]|nr:ETC complex I subunit [Pseudomonadota bacterium]